MPLEYESGALPLYRLVQWNVYFSVNIVAYTCIMNVWFGLLFLLVKAINAWDAYCALYSVLI
jgi:hypothetical protein